MAQLKISRPVGDIAVNGTSPNANLFDDILIVQYLLNKSPGPGKPNPPLAQNGDLSPEFFAAIRAYESTRGPVDGRIDPGDATMTALNGVPLGEFEGITDFLERRSVILRQRWNPGWNYTRGDYQTLTVTNGSALSFDPSTNDWLPDYFKTRILKLLNKILNPAETPYATWSVGTLDSYHWHLGFWSGTPGQPLSQTSQDWKRLANGPDGLFRGLEKVRKPFLGGLKTSFPSDIPGYRAAHAAWLRTANVKMLLQAYANSTEATIVHHTFEEDDWRPFGMTTEDPRRQWMIKANGDITKPPYTSHAELSRTNLSAEFYCEGMPQINLLIDRAGVIHPIIGVLQDLAIVAGVPSDVVMPPPSRTNKKGVDSL